MILDGLPQPGKPRQPWKLEPGQALAWSRTIVPTGKKEEHAPAPLPPVMTQLIPAGCEVMIPFPLPPGMIATLPCENSSVASHRTVAWYKQPQRWNAYQIGNRHDRSPSGPSRAGPERRPGDA